jgi:Ca-activated chloride channel family protein
MVILSQQNSMLLLIEKPILSFKKQAKKFVTLIVIVVAVLTYIYPQQFIDLWLTRDQQGQILFNTQRYEQAATLFTDTRWQAFSLYGAEKYDQAATLYSQYDSEDELLARANALAHARRYVKARDLYQLMLEKELNYLAASTNIKIVQKIIDDVNRMSESQKEEQGDSSKELGDEARTGDGADKKEMQKQQVEQLTAEQLLLDPALNEMWLRQVQKDPARFLSKKFHMQSESQKTVSSAILTGDVNLEAANDEL